MEYGRQECKLIIFQCGKEHITCGIQKRTKLLLSTRSGKAAWKNTQVGLQVRKHVYNREYSCAKASRPEKVWYLREI